MAEQIITRDYGLPETPMMRKLREQGWEESRIEGEEKGREEGRKNERFDMLVRASDSSLMPRMLSMQASGSISNYVTTPAEHTSANGRADWSSPRTGGACHPHPSSTRRSRSLVPSGPRSHPRGADRGRPYGEPPSPPLMRWGCGRHWVSPRMPSMTSHPCSRSH